MEFRVKQLSYLGIDFPQPWLIHRIGSIQSRSADRAPYFSCGYVAYAQHMQQSEAFCARQSGQRMRVAAADAKLT